MKNNTSNSQWAPYEPSEIENDPMQRIFLEEYDHVLKIQIENYPGWLKNMREVGVIDKIGGKDAIIVYTFMGHTLDQIEELSKIDTTGLSANDLTPHKITAFNILDACQIITGYTYNLAQKATSWDRLRRLALRAYSLSDLAGQAECEFTRFRIAETEFFLQSVAPEPKVGEEKALIVFNPNDGIAISKSLLEDSYQFLAEERNWKAENIEEDMASTKYTGRALPANFPDKGYLQLTEILNEAEKNYRLIDTSPRILNKNNDYGSRLKDSEEFFRLIDTVYNNIFPVWRPTEPGPLPDHVKIQMIDLTVWTGRAILRVFTEFLISFDYLALDLIRKGVIDPRGIFFEEKIIKK